MTFHKRVGPSFKFQLILHCIELDLFKITLMEIISFAHPNNPEKNFYHYFHPTANKSEVSEVEGFAHIHFENLAMDSSLLTLEPLIVCNIQRKIICYLLPTCGATAINHMSRGELRSWVYPAHRRALCFTGSNSYAPLSSQPTALSPSPNTTHFNQAGNP